jgi:hypothetical protein
VYKAAVQYSLLVRMRLRCKRADLSVPGAVEMACSTPGSMGSTARTWGNSVRKEKRQRCLLGWLARLCGECEHLTWMHLPHMILPQQDTVRGEGISSSGGGFEDCKIVAQVEQDSMATWSCCNHGGRARCLMTNWMVLMQLGGLVTNHVMIWPPISRSLWVHDCHLILKLCLCTRRLYPPWYGDDERDHQSVKTTEALISSMCCQPWKWLFSVVPI